MSILKRLNFGQLLRYFMRTLLLNIQGGDRGAKPNALSAEIELPPATLLLIDEMKHRGGDESRSATIQRLVETSVRSTTWDQVERRSWKPTAAEGTIKPLASAIYYYRKLDGTSKKTNITIGRDIAGFRMTLHDDGEHGNRSVQFANLSELRHALQRIDDPRIGYREADVLAGLFAESDWLA